MAGQLPPPRGLGCSSPYERSWSCSSARSVSGSTPLSSGGGGVILPTPLRADESPPLPRTTICDSMWRGEVGLLPTDSGARWGTGETFWPDYKIKVRFDMQIFAKTIFRTAHQIQWRVESRQRCVWRRNVATADPPQWADTGGKADCAGRNTYGVDGMPLLVCRL